MKQSELERCSIQNWYSTFKLHTIKTLFVPLPAPFIHYLLGSSSSADSSSSSPPPPFLLPRPASGADPLPRAPAHLLDPTSSLSLISSDSDSDSDADSDPPSPPSFPNLESAVTRAIADLGGAAFPKLNWSSPKDAAWITLDGTLCCRSFPDLALLLRSSDSISHDLSDALPSCSDHDPPSPPTFYLALRKWYPSFHPEMEFRCFVRQHQLIAISQRDVTSFYPQLLDRKGELLILITEFFNDIVKTRFESEEYTFDVYVTRGGRVKVIDFNPWGAFTLPLMFEWGELEEEGFGEEGVELRVVERRGGVRPGLKTLVPYDYLDMSEGSGWDRFFKRVDEEQRAQAQGVEEGGV